MAQNKALKPRHQRDIGRLISIIKSLALLNLWWREQDHFTITATQEDVDEGFKIWDGISVSQELNLPPYIYKLYQEVILPAWEAKQALGEGLSRHDVCQKHYDVYGGRPLDSQQLRHQIIPMLETAGLIYEEQDPNDKRKYLIFPTLPTTITTVTNNSGDEGGVRSEAISTESVETEFPF